MLFDIEISKREFSLMFMVHSSNQIHSLVDKLFIHLRTCQQAEVHLAKVYYLQKKFL